MEDLVSVQSVREFLQTNIKTISEVVTKLKLVFVSTSQTPVVLSSLEIVGGLLVGRQGETKAVHKEREAAGAKGELFRFRLLR